MNTQGNQYNTDYSIIQYNTDTMKINKVYTIIVTNMYARDNQYGIYPWHLI